MSKDKEFRKNVAMIILNSEKQVLIGERRGQIGQWQIPQGGIETGESLEEALQREILEETSLTDYTVLGRTHSLLRYEWPLGAKDKNKPNIDGQEQVYFVVQVSTESLKQLKPSDEFQQFRFVDVPEVLKGVVSFKREVYEKAFAELAQFWSDGD